MVNSRSLTLPPIGNIPPMCNSSNPYAVCCLLNVGSMTANQITTIQCNDIDLLEYSGRHTRCRLTQASKIYDEQMVLGILNTWSIRLYYYVNLCMSAPNSFFFIFYPLDIISIENRIKLPVIYFVLRLQRFIRDFWDLLLLLLNCNDDGARFGKYLLSLYSTLFYVFLSRNFFFYFLYLDIYVCYIFNFFSLSLHVLSVVSRLVWCFWLLLCFIHLVCVYVFYI